MWDGRGRVIGVIGLIVGTGACSPDRDAGEDKATISASLLARGRTAEQQATYANHRRMKGARGKRLARWRSEKVERTMAHSYETGGLRRIHLRGHHNILKRGFDRAPEWVGG